MKLKLSKVIGFDVFITFLSIVGAIMLVSIVILCIYAPLAVQGAQGEELGLENYLSIVFFIVLVFASLFEFGTMYYFLKDILPFKHQKGQIKKLKIQSISYTPTRDQLVRMTSAVAQNGRNARFRQQDGLYKGSRRKW